MLSSLGHQVVATADNGEQLVEVCLTVRPDLVITDIRMPGKDGIAAVRDVFRSTPLPVVLVTGYHAPEHIQNALDEMVLAYLSKPFQRHELELAIRRAVHRFEEFRALFADDGNARKAVKNREVLRLAKGVLMKGMQLGDRAAFQHLEQMARDRNLRLLDAAYTVINTEKTAERR
jgi:AmiR/NasT family two-component response regulator